MTLYTDSMIDPQMYDQRGRFSSGSGFVMCKIDILERWIELGYRSPAALRVWLWLIKAANRKNEVHAKEGSILAGARIARKTLFRAYALLEKMRFIERDKQIIHLNAMVVWKSHLFMQPHAELCELPKSKKSESAREIA